MNVFLAKSLPILRKMSLSLSFFLCLASPIFLLSNCDLLNLEERIKELTEEDEKTETKVCKTIMATGQINNTVPVVQVSNYYDRRNNSLTFTNSNGYKEIYYYDSLEDFFAETDFRWTYHTQEIINGNAISTWHYSYNADGQVVNEIGPDAAHNIFDTWDDHNRPLTSTYKDSSCSDQARTFNYDTENTRVFTMSGGTGCTDATVTSTVTDQGLPYLWKREETSLTQSTQTTVLSTTDICEGDEIPDNPVSEAGELTISLDLTSGGFTNEPIDIKLFSGSTLSAVEATGTVLDGAGDLTATLKAPDGSGSATATNASLEPGNYLLVLTLDVGSDGIISAADGAIVKTIHLTGATVLSFTTNDFDFAVNVSGYATGTDVALNTANLQCWWLIPGGDYSDATQVLATSATSAMAAGGAGYEATVAPATAFLPQMTVDVFCYVDVDGSADLNSGDFKGLKTNVSLNDGGATPVSSTINIIEEP